MKLFTSKESELYYSSDKIDETNSTYRIVIGQRSNGKTYCCIRKVIIEYFKNGMASAYIRRYAEELKAKNIQELLSPHLDLIKKLSKGKYNNVFYRSNCFYLGFYDNNKGEWIIRDKNPILYTISINNWNISKGQDRGSLNFIIFDEFMSRDGYLSNEFSSFTNVLSSLIRSREGIVVYMLANTVNKYCPYFEEMNLYNVENQLQGTIEVYSYNNDKLTVAVEYCAPSKSTKKIEYYYAFDNPSTQMITAGNWEEASYRHLSELEFNIDNSSTLIFRFYVKFSKQLVVGEIHQKNSYIALVFHKFGNSNYQIKDNDIMFTDSTSSNSYWFNSFRGNTKLHSLIKKLFEDESDFYETNAVGEVIRNFKKWSSTQN